MYNAQRQRAHYLEIIRRRPKNLRWECEIIVLGVIFTHSLSRIDQQCFHQCTSRAECITFAFIIRITILLPKVGILVVGLIIKLMWVMTGKTYLKVLSDESSIATCHWSSHRCAGHIVDLTSCFSTRSSLGRINKVTRSNHIGFDTELHDSIIHW